MLNNVITAIKMHHTCRGNLEKTLFFSPIVKCCLVKSQIIYKTLTNRMCACHLIVNLMRLVIRSIVVEAAAVISVLVFIKRLIGRRRVSL